MTEPDVTLTDYGLAVECAVLAVMTLRLPAGRTRPTLWFAILFGGIGGAALFGGTVHGFFLDPDTPGNAILWRATLVCIGVSALAAWRAGAELVLSSGKARILSVVVSALWVGYLLHVLFVDQGFRAAVYFYVPAVVFLAAAFVARLPRSRNHLSGVAALVLMLAASVLQQARIGFHPVYFNHNALYHLIHGIALVLLYVGGPRALALGFRQGR